MSQQREQVEADAQSALRAGERAAANAALVLAALSAKACTVQFAEGYTDGASVPYRDVKLRFDRPEHAAAFAEALKKATGQ